MGSKRARGVGERGLRREEGERGPIGTTVEMLGRGSPRKGEVAVGEGAPKGGATPWGRAGGDRRLVLYGEKAGSSHCGCGCSVNGGGMLSGWRGAEKSTMGCGSVRARSSSAPGNLEPELGPASSELSEASDG